MFYFSQNQHNLFLENKPIFHVSCCLLCFWTNMATVNLRNKLYLTLFHIYPCISIYFSLADWTSQISAKLLKLISLMETMCLFFKLLTKRFLQSPSRKNQNNNSQHHDEREQCKQPGFNRITQDNNMFPYPKSHIVRTRA